MTKTSAVVLQRRGLRAPFLWTKQVAAFCSRCWFRFLHSGLCALLALPQRLCMRIAPEEQVGERLPPWTALFRLGPCLSWWVLVWNDHWGKGSSWLPAFIAGKLSDFAGLAFFPLLLVTLGNSTMFVISRRLPRFAPLGSLHLFHLQLSCLLTGLLFSAVQLSPVAADLYRQACIALFPWEDGRMVQVVSDPTDLWALCALFGAYRWGQGALAQLPPGRLHLACMQAARFDLPEQRLGAIKKALADVQRSQPPGARKPMQRLILACAEKATESELRVHLQGVRKELQKATQTCKAAASTF